MYIKPQLYIYKEEEDEPINLKSKREYGFRD